MSEGKKKFNHHYRLCFLFHRSFFIIGSYHITYWLRNSDMTLFIKILLSCHYFDGFNDDF